MAKDKIKTKVKIKLADNNTESNKKAKSTKAKVSSSSKAGGSSKSTSQNKKPQKPKESNRSRERRLARQRLDKLQTQLAKRVREANEIVEEYGDYEHLQPIFADARRTLPPSRKNSGELFTTDIKSEKSMMREIARIDVFEAQVRGRRDDYYEEDIIGKSTKRPLTQEQADRVTQMRRNFYKGAFGGQWMRKNDDGETYDKSRIVKEFAEEAFSIYSHLTETTSEDYIKMLWNKKLGKSQYESETLIIAIYDMVSMGYSRKSIDDFLASVTDQLQKDYVSRQFESPFDYGEL